MDNELKGTILAILTAIVSGISIVANKVFVVDIDTRVFTGLRSLAIGLMFILMIFLQKEKIRVKKLNIKALLAIGVIGGGLAFLLFFSGLKLTTAGRAAFLHKTLPLYVAVLAYLFLRERMNKTQLVAMLVMIGGLLLMSLSTLTVDMGLGDVLVLAATMLWAVENVLAKKAIKEGSGNLVVSASRMLIGGVLIISALAALGDFRLLLALSIAQLMNILLSTLLLFLYVLFYYWSLKYIKVSKAATLLLLAPVLSLCLSVFFLGENPPVIQIIGSGLILAGAAVTARSEHQLV